MASITVEGAIPVCQALFYGRILVSQLKSNRSRKYIIYAQRLQGTCRSPNCCALHQRDLFLPGASSSVWDCRLIRRSGERCPKKT